MTKVFRVCPLFCSVHELSKKSNKIRAIIGHIDTMMGDIIGGCKSASCLEGQRWQRVSADPSCFYARWCFPSALLLKQTGRQTTPWFRLTYKIWKALRFNNMTFRAENVLMLWKKKRGKIILTLVLLRILSLCKNPNILRSMSILTNFKILR